MVRNKSYMKIPAKKSGDAIGDLKFPSSSKMTEPNQKPDKFNDSKLICNDVVNFHDVLTDGEKLNDSSSTSETRTCRIHANGILRPLRDL